MSLSATIAPHLPFLRRFSRAVSGSQESGDAMVAAMLEAIIADVDIFPQASSDRVALYVGQPQSQPHLRPSICFGQRNSSAQLSSNRPRRDV